MSSGSGGSGALLTLDDYARGARERMEPSVWDFIAGGAGRERTLAANTAAFERVRLLPRVLTASQDPVTATQLLKTAASMPLAIAPMAYHTLVHPEGEVATARAAAVTGVPLVVSTFAGRTFEDIAAVARAPLWLQLYCFRDRSITRALIERAENAGFEALMLTVDAPHLGRRLRDLRNDFRLPASIVPANLDAGDFSSPGGHALAEFDPTLDWSVVAWLKTVTSLPVIVKGVLAAADADRAVGAGVDAIVVSNHGGRQLDGVPATIEVLPQVVSAVGSTCPVFLDGGVRSGADVIAALASGAAGVLVGRPVLYGLSVNGSEGVAGVLAVLATELVEALRLGGVNDVAEVQPELIISPFVASASQPAPQAAPVNTGSGLKLQDMHASLSDPLLDTMNFLNEVTGRYPDAISFAPGRPYPGHFDTAHVFTYIGRYLEHLASQGRSSEQIRDFLYQYGPTSGHIRELIAEWLRTDEDIDVPAESIVVTVGCQEAMLLSLRALIGGSDDVLFVSTPCYVGITGAAALLDIRPVAIPEGPDGFNCAVLEQAIIAQLGQGRRPRAFYVVPDHANPSGTTMSIQARHELLELAGRFDLIVLEDSPYRLVSAGEQAPTLKSLDRHRQVVHLGSFAKTLFPGARVGFAVADQLVDRSAGRTGLLADELSKIKSMVTVNTSPLSQAAVAGMLLAGGGSAVPLNVETSAHYQQAMRSVLCCLEEQFPSSRRTATGITWNKPSGGFFLNLTVPFPADDAALRRSAEEFGVIWTPMSYFHLDGAGAHGIRLSVSYLDFDTISEGIRRLAHFIDSEISRH